MATEELKRARSRIQKQVEQAEEERKRQLLRRRIELANQGVRAYQAHRIQEAVKAFHTYISILEDWKKVPQGGLSPAHFDLEKDVPELLLISGVYWDLVKLYDRTKSKERAREFHDYLQKYVLFSKGMPYQALSAETLRKYIRAEKPVHREEFKNAYKAIAGNNCFVATSLVELIGEDTLPALRDFRDQRLARNPCGVMSIWAYYRIGPAMAWAMDRAPRRVRMFSARLLDQIARRV